MLNNALLTTREVTQLVRGQATSDGAGVRSSRAIGTPALEDLDPFLLLDELRSDDGADYVAGFPDHPHRGFEIVTYMLAGSMEHRDQIGNHGVLETGGVQWMTAGRGVIRSEVPRQDRGQLWGVQLWVNLPASEKLCEPRYQDIPSAAIPQVSLGRYGKVRVIAGEFEGVRGATNGIAIEPLYLDVTLAGAADQLIEIPSGHNACLYVLDGAVQVIGAGRMTQVSRGKLGVLSHEGPLLMRSAALGARLLVIAGRALKEPVARYGPFVMNTREQVQRAVEDLRSGRFLG
ncbi:MAG TPA: pirin family protein [Polyangiales bacterium]|jgi:redox-sensitive bicupin YhaK (pirin superfamily)|nr:pirin family protein [Polyangiales bacterium]